jgi:hypothetical protein
MTPILEHWSVSRPMIFNFPSKMWVRVRDEGRLIDGRTQRVGQAMAEERNHLLALPAEGFDLAEISFPVVDGGGCVRTNAYSTPVRPGTPVQVKVYPAHLEVWHDGRCVAHHERCYSWPFRIPGAGKYLLQ